MRLVPIPPEDEFPDAVQEARARWEKIQIEKEFDTYIESCNPDEKEMRMTLRERAMQVYKDAEAVREAERARQDKERFKVLSEALTARIYAVLGMTPTRIWQDGGRIIANVEGVPVCLVEGRLTLLWKNPDTQYHSTVGTFNNLEELGGLLCNDTSSECGDPFGD